jgi:hypothetical protein
MVNQQTAMNLLLRLPLLAGDLKPEHYLMLAMKWGNEDGEYHSSKAVIKKLGLAITPEEVKAIEGKAVAMIESELTKIFSCTACGTDVRKCGVKRTAHGFQVADIYISSDGTLTRSRHTSFHKAEGKQPAYGCGNENCQYAFKPSDPVSMFLGGPISFERIARYMLKFKDIDITKLSVRARKSPNMPVWEPEDNEEL